MHNVDTHLIKARGLCMHTSDAIEKARLNGGNHLGARVFVPCRVLWLELVCNIQVSVDQYSTIIAPIAASS